MIPLFFLPSGENDNSRKSKQKAGSSATSKDKSKKKVKNEKKGADSDADEDGKELVNFAKCIFSAHLFLSTCSGNLCIQTW